MKKAQLHIILLTLSVFLTLPALSLAKEIPVTVGGFILGGDVTDYPDIEYSNFLKEVVVYDWNGFAKGIISYGICDSPGEIVKIKLKYKDPSKKFFKTLLKKFKKKYGKPHEWKGDSFGILHVWKWKFTNSDGTKIHMILQHNTKNPNENTGNMVKLYCPDQMVKEQRCFTKQCTSRQSPDKKEPKIDWNLLIPQTKP